MTTYDSDSHALARRRILAAMDEIVARFVLHAERLQRFDDAAPTLVVDQVAGRASAIALALARYREGAYEAAATLAGPAGADARGGEG